MKLTKGQIISVGPERKKGIVIETTGKIETISCKVRFPDNSEKEVKITDVHTGTESRKSRRNGTARERDIRDKLKKITEAFVKHAVGDGQLWNKDPEKYLDLMKQANSLFNALIEKNKFATNKFNKLKDYILTEYKHGVDSLIIDIPEE